MLRDTPCKPDQKLRVDGDWMEFSLAPEGTKVSPRTFHKTLGLMQTARRLWPLLE